MADGKRMSKTELFKHFTEKFGMKRTEVSALFDELQSLSEAELRRAGDGFGGSDTLFGHTQRYWGR